MTYTYATQRPRVRVPSPPPFISNIERGYRMPSVPTPLRLAAGLGVAPSVLVGIDVVSESLEDRASVLQDNVDRAIPAQYGPVWHDGRIVAFAEQVD